MKELTHYICTERSELFEPNVLICYAVDLMTSTKEHILTARELQEAAQKAWQANETCYSRITIREDGSAGYLPVSECQNTFQVTEPHTDVLQIIQDEERKPFRIDQGELMRIFYIPQDEQSGRLLLMAHHLVGDGKSILFFLQDLLHSLTGLQVSHKEMTEVDPRDLPEKSKLRPLVQAYCNRVNKKWRKEACVFQFEDYFRLVETYWENRRSFILTEQFSIQELNTLLKLAHEKKITLSTLISVHLLRACETGRKLTRTGFAVDTRLPGDESMSNQVAGISVDMKYNDKKDIWENAQSFQKLMKKSLASPAHRYFVYQVLPAFEPCLFDSVFFSRFGLRKSRLSEAYSRVMGYAAGSERTIGITNLNRLPIKEQYEKVSIQSCMFIPPAVTYSKRTVGIVTNQSNMQIVYHGVTENGVEPDTLFFTKAMQELHNLAKERN